MAFGFGAPADPTDLTDKDDAGSEPFGMGRAIDPELERLLDVSSDEARGFGPMEWVVGDAVCLCPCPAFIVIPIGCPCILGEECMGGRCGPVDEDREGEGEEGETSLSVVCLLDVGEIDACLRACWSDLSGSETDPRDVDLRVDLGDNVDGEEGG